MKYVFDKIISFFSLILFFPILIMVWVLIKIKMPNGSPFYKQKRVGLQGRLFTMIKFRTMSAGHIGNSISVLDESRITPLGAILRKYKLDELPELWNVFKGDMSIVGPRPDVPGYADKLQGEERKILKLRPGITGPASLKYSNEERILAKVANPKKYNDEVIYPDKVRINLDYYNNHNFCSDIVIIWKTVFRKNY